MTRSIRAIRAMVIEDFPLITELWQRTDGIGLNEADTEPALDAFLRRNPGASAVALDSSGALVGAVLCGHDGRRGYLHHLAVDAPRRNLGIAADLMSWCFNRLTAAGIPKCNIVVFRDNTAAGSFWRHNGWVERTDLSVFQKAIRTVK